MIDIVRDLVSIDGKHYALSAYRSWLSAEHPSLVKNHFIKTISKGGKLVRTYDWAAVYATAKEYNFHLNFKDDYQRDRAGSKEADAIPVASPE
jgi:hypothetical protein